MKYTMWLLWYLIKPVGRLLLIYGALVVCFVGAMMLVAWCVSHEPALLAIPIILLVWLAVDPESFSAMLWTIGDIVGEYIRTAKRHARQRKA